MSNEADTVARELDARLHTSAWDPQPAVTPATGVADFALALSGKRKQARKSGRWSKLIRHFALAACLALASVAAACDRPNANATATAEAISQLQPSSAANATITKGNPSNSPGNFSELVLVSPGTDAEPWAVMVPRTSSGSASAPILVDRAGADLSSVGSVYNLAAQPVQVGTRDGPSQFLDPLVPADETGTADTGQQAQNVSSWQQDERYLAATRAIKGEPTVLDAAYNAEAAANAGGTHTYQNGVVLRVEPDQPVLQVIDKALLESGKPTRAEDVVYVAIRPSEKSLYEPGTVVNLRDVVMDRQQTDVNGQATTMYVANAALDGARVEPTGKVDLQALLQPRLQRVDQDLAAQAQDPGTQTGAAPAAATATPGAQQQTVIVNQGHNSYVPDFLIWMWLANSGFYRGPSVIINNPPSSPTRSGDVFYSPPPNTSSSSPSTVASSQADARATALQASRSAVSGQSGGTGGGVAATNKSASEASSRVSAATAKAATVAGAVGAASAGKSISSVPKSTSSTSSRSAGSVSAGSRGTSISSSSSSSSGGGFGGKGIGSSSSS